MRKGFPWLVFAATAAVVVAAFSAANLVVPFAVAAALLALALPFVMQGSSDTAVGEAAAPPPSEGEPASPALPSAPPNYELGEHLASGTMGEVLRARHKQLKRDVAFKRIKPGNIDQEDTKRFEREARVLSSLRSPHTVEVFDAGVTPSGDLYYAMELLDGIDLQTAIREYGPFPPERVVHLLIQACTSLKEAHAQGLVHRDIKPANFMICRYGGELDFLKVLDFGLVKKPAGKESTANVTNASTVLGTPAYLSPESINGSKFVDGRADLYALGAVAFWMLTGRLLFESDHALTMVKLHLTEPPPRASAHSKFKIPGALDSLLHDCVQKKPEERPSSAEVVRRRLEEIPLDERWNQDRAAAWWTKHVPAKTSPAGSASSS
jgi:serine/threonine-protein kinase